MKKFLLRISLLALVITIPLSLIESTLREIPNNYSYKKENLEKNTELIETLVLGSSHAFYGVNPKFIGSYTFNLANVSQSIDYDYELLDKYVDDLVNLKTIVVPIDYLSVYHRLEEGKETWRAKNYEVYFQLYKSSNLYNYFELSSQKFSDSFEKYLSFVNNENISLITCDNLGYGDQKKEQSDLLVTGENAAFRHTKTENNNIDENISFYNKIINIAKERKFRIIFVTYPAYKTYTTNLDKYQLSEMYRLSSKLSISDNCHYFDFLNDYDFEEKHFRDADHLNYEGAKLFSSKLNDLINEISKNSEIN
jgi:hypothetical protein